VVRALAWADGAVLLEELKPAEQLVTLTLAGRDLEATEIVAQLAASMTPDCPTWPVPTAADWGRGFQRYLASGDGQIAADLLAEAGAVYARLCATERNPRLLHGDLHHYDILFDAERGWLAIDPKGVISELEFELGAWLRTPGGHPDLLSDPATVERRLERLGACLPIDPTRTLAWAFAQGVQPAVWTVEDTGRLPADHAGLALSNAIRCTRVGHGT
jgi:streptomycin 6-kinase